MFVVLAPSCQHANLDILCDFGTWLERGWCNMEFLCSTLAPFKQDQLLIRGAEDIMFTNPLRALHSPPGIGRIDTFAAAMGPGVVRGAWGRGTRTVRATASVVPGGGGREEGEWDSVTRASKQ